VRVGVMARRRVLARVALLTQHPKHMRHNCYLWSLSLSVHRIFQHYLKNGTIFGKKLLNKKLRFDFLYNFIP
jgi:hypothetical protein